MTEALQEARARLAQGRAGALQLHREGAGGREVVRAITKLTDEVVAALFAALCAETPGTEPCALVATGGYGRKELAPRSDVDLLVVLPTDARRERADRIAEKLHRALWDLGFEVGFAARTVDQCVSLAREDHTIRTALIDARYLAGDDELMNALERAVVTQIEPRDVEGFIADKLEELEERRKRYGGSVWLLEPHLKQGKGGLRDLQTALWIAHARHGVASLTEVARKQLLPARDVDAARAARDVLFRLRNELHWQTNRRDDRLTFENQRKAAAALGYVDKDQELAVERLMRDAYIALAEIARATDALVDRCAREDVPRRKSQRKAIDEAFALQDGRVAVNGKDVFAKRPSEIIRLYETAERYGVPVASAARDLAVHELFRLQPDDRDAHFELWQLLVREGSLGKALWPLHELGVLAALFPEMNRLRGRAQHSLYHVYTVDTHTVFALTRLMQLRAGALAQAEPELTRIARAQERPLALMLGLLFHDLGKGLGDDHSKRGAQLAKAYAARIGLDPEDATDIEWLVAAHLRMSHISQRRDLEDPRLIDDFAREVQSVERLEMLYLLTYADMASVSPENWTSWKAGLLRALYLKTRAALVQEGLDAPAHAHSLDHRRERIAKALPKDAAPFVQVLPERYLNLHFARPEQVRRDYALWQTARKAGFAGELAHDELTLIAQDKPGLLALFAAALAANGMDVLAADVTSLDGMALDRFTVREPGGGTPDAERWQATQADLLRLLSGSEEPGKLVQKRLRRASWAASAAPPVATQIRLENGILDVITQDRPGLLYTIAEALHGARVSIEVARVATEGNRAADAFYLRDVGGGRAPAPLHDAARVREIVEAVERATASLAARG